MAFKNIEKVNEIKYEGYQFVDKNGTTYKAKFKNMYGVTAITDGDSDNPIMIYTADLPRLIRVLQAVYDKSN
jgi:hypothetical protein